MGFYSSIRHFTILLLLLLRGLVNCTTFTFTNKCGETVWPGLLSNSGISPLQTTGFTLEAGESQSLVAPSGWGGRFWGRTGCSFDSTTGHGSCSTGDCGSGEIECKGAGAAPPATLIEFTLDGSDNKDFYDVSLVDGYNLPVMVEASGGSNGCAATGCVVDLNSRCPTELRIGEGKSAACRSACEAFSKPEYCCSGEFGTPDKCQPSVYSQVFKSACPRSYSYAYDDASSTFTCVGPADYVITFCPVSSPTSQKTTKNPSPRPTDEMLEDDAWLASLAAADANQLLRRDCFSRLLHSILALMSIIFLLLR
ncbi:hypothetical protein LUZ63_009791 [Rhynchospora breviuscula]|uniref:Thaumatin-like protein 1 n=1 Tax=Rhynchospora breviuscula TaxID=2022672 RepID=A0A9Q0CFV0_9POAL|nr:hypothetical protein LUZ63_009791 [Rhynchospora breviuscula]